MSLPCQVKDWFAPTRSASESEIRAAVMGFPRPLSWADFRSVHPHRFHNPKDYGRKSAAGLASALKP